MRHTNKSSSHTFMPASSSNNKEVGVGASSTSGQSVAPHPVGICKAIHGKTYKENRSQLARDNAILKLKLEMSNRLVEGYKKKLFSIMTTKEFDHEETKCPKTNSILESAKVFTDVKQQLAQQEELEENIDSEFVSINEENAEEMGSHCQFEECFVSGVPEPEDASSECGDDDSIQELTDSHFTFVPTPFVPRDVSRQSEPLFEGNEYPSLDSKDRAGTSQQADLTVSEITVIKREHGEFAEDNRLQGPDVKREFREVLEEDGLLILQKSIIKSESGLKCEDDGLLILQKSIIKSESELKCEEDDLLILQTSIIKSESGLECEKDDLLAAQCCDDGLSQDVMMIKQLTGDEEEWIVENEDGLECATDNKLWKGDDLQITSAEAVQEEAASPSASETSECDSDMRADAEHSHPEVSFFISSDEEREGRETKSIFPTKRGQNPRIQGSSKNKRGAYVFTSDNHLWVVDKPLMNARSILKPKNRKPPSDTTATFEQEVAVKADHSALPTEPKRQKPLIMCRPNLTGVKPADWERLKPTASNRAVSRHKASRVASRPLKRETSPVAGPSKSNRRKQSIVCKSDAYDARPAATPALEDVVTLSSEDDGSDSDPEFYCRNCYETFADEREMYRHIADRHGVDQLHECHVCGETFPKPSLLAAHKRSHAAAQTFLCLECDRSYGTAFGLECHACGEQDDGGGFRCGLCSVRCVSEWCLVAHKCAAANEQRQTRTACRICEVGVSWRLLFRHMSDAHSDVLMLWNVVEDDCKDLGLCD